MRFRIHPCNLQPATCNLKPKMKKPLIILIAILLLCVLFACNKAVLGYEEYFVNYASQKPYTEAVEVFNVSKDEKALAHPLFNAENVYINRVLSSSGMYVIKDSKTGLEGLCSESEFFLAPIYTRIIEIRGDYAIAVRPIAFEGFTKLYNCVGVVKFRGANSPKEFGFRHEYFAGIEQYKFISDNLLMVKGALGNSYLGQSTRYDFAKIYDFVSGGGVQMLEVGEIRISAFLNMNLSSVSLYDNIITVVNSDENKATFLSLNKIDKQGRFEILLEQNGLIDTNKHTVDDRRHIELEIYYVGNDWFILRSIYVSTVFFDDYDLTREDSKGTTRYLLIRSARLNVKSNLLQSFAHTGVDKMLLVVNKYNYNQMRELADAYNDEEHSKEYNGETFGLYYPPVVPPSALIKDGFTILYYASPTWPQGFLTYVDTFCIMDSRANIIRLNELWMPLILVDGIGVLTADINFGMPPNDAEFFHIDKKRIVADKIIDSRIFYNTVATHAGITLVNRVNLDDPTIYGSLMGAYNSKGVLAVPYEYEELSLFFGEYALGSILSPASGNNVAKKYYRVSRTGGRTELSDVYTIKNGVYITREGKKYGLKANDGTLLIPNRAESISVIDSYLVGGVFVKTAVVTVEDGEAKIYRLK